MIGRGPARLAAAKAALTGACARLGRDLSRDVRRLRRGKRGVVAVEFALVLPMMLALYFGCVVLVQGLEVGRKTQALSRTLADLASQTLPVDNQTNPVLTDTEFVNFFSAWSAVLYPFTNTGSPNMTLSQVVLRQCLQRQFPMLRREGAVERRLGSQSDVAALWNPAAIVQWRERPRKHTRRAVSSRGGVGQRHG